ncbi:MULTISPECIES: DUF5082 family protein [Bacillus cereus group]|uniref:DUF5082 domain-containing protein n=4 Tax=Bacillus TaxID=1386 RepID=A0A1E8BVU9_BACMY|nr:MULTISPECIES: DUF5082 family protein [Bacillus cereus group]EJV57191.1 hypothetical protein IEM_04972 [Bacillus cereus BAG6O-2]MBJ8073320.1 DUF5082 family protein [Bacillus cereus]MBJ8190480.1 DUF5082 family protein [Bacillus cereus]MDM5460183.1 DUF5082 family protein [Bacillus cereus]MED1436822.1 DUF5082 family protein [Bacillus mycoides]
MAQEEDKAKEAARKADIHASVDRFKASYDSKMASHRANAQKLERLKAAKRSLQGELHHFDSYKKEFTNLGTSLTTSQFKGARRKKFDEKLKEIVTALDADKEKHNEKLNTMNNKIILLEMDQSIIGDAIASISASISGLRAML